MKRLPKEWPSRSLLQTPQQDTKPGTATNGDDLWPALPLSVSVNRVRQVGLSARMEEGSQYRTVQLNNSNGCGCDAGNAEEERTYRPGEELKCQIIKYRWEGCHSIEFTQ